MSKPALIVLAMFAASVLCAEEPAPRQKVVVDGKTFPVYEFVKEVKPTKVENPVYPAGSHNDGKGGVARVGAVVDEKGRVTATFIAQADAPPDIQRAARTAVSRWRFPVMKEGDAAIAYVVFVPIAMRPK